MQSNSSTMAIIQASAFYEHDFGPKLIHASPNSSPEGIYGVYQEPDSPPKNFTMSNSSSVSSPSSSNSNGLIYNLSEEGHSVINFKPEFGNFIHASGSFLSFDQTKRAVPISPYPKMLGDDDEYPAVWDADLHYQMDPKSAHGLPETSSSHHAATDYGSPLPWLNDQEVGDGAMETSNNKRPSTGENEQALKKQCVASKKTKPKPESTSKDPQSVAAKNRRERISERLKILQELVPNGSKVDLVTMLEKAIGYVKFLQLQVKVLATDEFWPAQGEKAPDLSQVREAIDAILASQRDRNSSSKS
ncbi:hypothetical protein ACS0TY_029147 [Phlomoides rotata]